MSWAPRSLRARWATVAFVVLCTSVPALLLSAPGGWLVGGLWGAMPEGDLVVFRPGAFFLFETLRTFNRELRALVSLGPWLLLLLSALSILPWTALLCALASPERQTPSTLARLAVGKSGTMLFLFGIGLLMRVLTALLGYVLVDVVGRGLGGGQPARELVSMLSCGLVAIALLSAVRVVHDLAQAAVVRQDERGAGALWSALDAFRRRPLAATIAWGWRSLLSLALVALAAVVVQAVGVETKAHLLLVALVHQATLALLVVLRASWLRDALQLIGEPPFTPLRDEPAQP